jgi:hypothetical protein
MDKTIPTFKAMRAVARAAAPARAAGDQPLTGDETDRTVTRPPDAAFTGLALTAEGRR